MHSCPCTPASCRPVHDPLSLLISPSPHCLLSLLSSPLSSPVCLLCCLFLSFLWHVFLFIKLPMMTAYNSINHWRYSLLCVSQYMRLRQRTKERLLTVLSVFCAAGLVCMKSSTSVVELVMLLCSQVSHLYHPLSSPRCPRTNDPLMIHLNPNTSRSLKFLF